jgi:hypothetical protein
MPDPSQLAKTEIKGLLETALANTIKTIETESSCDPNCPVKQHIVDALAKAPKDTPLSGKLKDIIANYGESGYRLEKYTQIKRKLQEALLLLGGSSGGSSKIIIGVVVVVALAIGIYFMTKK